MCQPVRNAEVDGGRTELFQRVAEAAYPRADLEASGPPRAGEAKAPSKVPKGRAGCSAQPPEAHARKPRPLLDCGGVHALGATRAEARSDERIEVIT